MTKITDKEVNNIVVNLTLNMFNVGTDKTNYKIIQMLPTDIKTLMKEFNLTKMPVNTRVNELEKAGLVKRMKGTGKVIPTNMTGYLLELIDTIKDRVEDEIKNQLSELN